MIRLGIIISLLLNLESVYCNHGRLNGSVNSGQFLQNERFKERRDYGYGGDHMNVRHDLRNTTRYVPNLGNNTQSRQYQHYNSLNLNNYRNNSRVMGYENRQNEYHLYPNDHHYVNNHMNGSHSYNSSRNNSRKIDYRDHQNNGYDHHLYPNDRHHLNNHRNQSHHRHRNNSRLLDYRNHQNFDPRYDYQGYQSDQHHKQNHNDKHQHQSDNRHHDSSHGFNNENRINFPHHQNNHTHFDHKQHKNITNQHFNQSAHHPSLPNIFGNHSSSNHHSVNLTEEQRAALAQQFFEITKEFPLITAPQRTCPEGYRKDRSGICRELF